MQLLRRHKSVLIALGIYWPFIFWLTHIPIPMPSIALRSGLSDKTMHAMAYFALAFLVWFAVSPYHKVRWRARKVWLVLLFIACYGAIDEILQRYVGRSMDVLDFTADLFGAVLALGLLTLFSFWTALLTASAVFIFIISNLSYLLKLYPQYRLDTVFHFTAYTAFALIWIQHAERYASLRLSGGRSLFYALLVPAGLLLLVEVTAPLFNRSVGWIEVAAAVFGICAAIVVSWLTVCLTRRNRRKPSQTPVRQ